MEKRESDIAAALATCDPSVLISLFIRHMPPPTQPAVLDDAQGHQLNEWVAEYVLGWRWLLSPWSRNRRRYLAPPSDHKFGTPAREDEPAIPHDPIRFAWTIDMGHAWPVIETVRSWPVERRLRFLSALAMQYGGPDHPLEWLAFNCREPAIAVCRAALIASINAQRGASDDRPTSPVRSASNDDDHDVAARQESRRRETPT